MTRILECALPPLSKRAPGQALVLGLAKRLCEVVGLA